MAFRCESCKQAQPARSKPHRVVTQTRNILRPVPRTEIVKEANLCEYCWQEREYIKGAA